MLLHIPQSVLAFMNASIAEALITVINCRLLLGIFQSSFQHRLEVPRIDQNSFLELDNYRKASGRAERNAWRVIVLSSFVLCTNTFHLLLLTTLMYYRTN